MNGEHRGRTDVPAGAWQARLRFLESALPPTLFAVGFLAFGIPVSAQVPEEAQPEPAQRVVIEYFDGHFEVLSQTYLRKVLPPHDVLPRGQDPALPRELSGFWYELLGDGAVRYRRSVENPIVERFEGIGPEDPTGGITRVESLPVRQVFSVLVPFLGPEVDQELVIVSSPLEPGRQHLAASEIARLPLGIPDGWAPDPIP